MSKWIPAALVDVHVDESDKTASGRFQSNRWAFAVEGDGFPVAMRHYMMQPVEVKLDEDGWAVAMRTLDGTKFFAYQENVPPRTFVPKTVAHGTVGSGTMPEMNSKNRSEEPQ